METRVSGARNPSCATSSPTMALMNPSPPGGHTESRDILAISLQLTDLKVNQQVVFAVAWPRAGPCQGAELGGGHWG